jgi:hypothetical protein
MLLFTHLNIFFNVILHIVIPLCKHFFFHLFLLFSLFFHSYLFCISYLNIHYFFSFFFCFFNFFPCLFKFVNLQVISDKVTFYSSILSRAILLANNLTSSSALFLDALDPTSFFVTLSPPSYVASPSL